MKHNNLYETGATYEVLDVVYCWHTEDFARNQIIHSYGIDKSYIVNKIKR